MNIIYIESIKDNGLIIFNLFIVINNIYKFLTLINIFNLHTYKVCKIILKHAFA